MPGLEPQTVAPAVPLTLTLISAGGVLGAVTRCSADVALPFTSLQTTWAINVSGCFLMGVLMTVTGRDVARQRFLRPFLGVGFLGGYTTFSTYVVDVETAGAAEGLIYLVLTVTCALLAVRLGRRLGGLAR